MFLKNCKLKQKLNKWRFFMSAQFLLYFQKHKYRTQHQKKNYVHVYKNVS